MKHVIFFSRFRWVRILALVWFGGWLVGPVAAQYTQIVKLTNSWRYSDTGATNLGTVWRAKEFDDSSWKAGCAPFGALEPAPLIPICTPIPSTISGAAVLSHFFRTHFTMPAVSSNLELVFSNLVDDGAVFYINGAESYRLRMPTNVIQPRIPAPTNSQEGLFDFIIVPATNCVPGDNVLAVEIHQNLIAPLDFFFATSVGRQPVTPIRLVRPPKSAFIYDGLPHTISNRAAGSPPHFFQWYKDGRPISGATSSNYTILRASEADEGVYQVHSHNLFSTVESPEIDCRLKGSVPSFLRHPVTNSLVFDGDGLPLVLTADTIGSRPLSWQWYHDGEAMPGERTATVTSQNLTLTPPRRSDAGVYRLVAANRYGRATSEVARVNVRAAMFGAGAIDLAFRGAIPPNCRVVVDSANRILVVGGTNSAGSGTQPWISRLLPDGSPDPTFFAAASNRIGYCYSILIQPDGKIVVGGDAVGGRGGLVRVLPNGILDPNFSSITGTDGRIFAIARQADGKLLIGGSFSRCNNIPRANFARLNADGTLDETFTIGTGFDFNVNAVFARANDKILVGGAFARFNGVNRGLLAQLNPDGTLDATFAPAGGTLKGTVLEIQSSGTNFLLAGAIEAAYGGRTNRFLARMSGAGVFDTNMLVGTVFSGSSIQSLYQQPADGRILVAGSFRWINAAGQSVSNLARVMPNGSLDYSFNPVRATGVGTWSVAAQACGLIVVSGPTAFDGVPRPNLIRLVDSSAELRAEIDAPGKVVLTWPFTALPDPYVLQVSAEASPPEWADVATIPTLSGGRYRVTWPLNGQRTFFRLVRCR